MGCTLKLNPGWNLYENGKTPCLLIRSKGFERLIDVPDAPEEIGSWNSGKVFGDDAKRVHQALEAGDSIKCLEARLLDSFVTERGDELHSFAIDEYEIIPALPWESPKPKGKVKSKAAAEEPVV